MSVSLIAANPRKGTPVPTFRRDHYIFASENPKQVQLAGDTVVFQPGDGTRYVVRFSLLDVEGGEARVYGCSNDSELVTVMTGPNRYATACLSPDSYPGYIQEKLGVSEYTAKVLYHLLGWYFEARKLPPFPFDSADLSV
jgi:hypothetical protein